MTEKLNLSTLLSNLLLSERTEVDQDYEGTTGAGVLVYAKKTKRFLLGLRSNETSEPGTWGIFGGSVQKGENPQSAAERELYEETGYKGPLHLHFLYTYKDGEFTYHNFLGVVDEEFTPHEHWEHDNYEWIKFGDWPDPLHFGTATLLRHAHADIEHIIIADYSDLDEASVDLPPPPPAIVRKVDAPKPAAVKVNVPTFATQKPSAAPQLPAALPEPVIGKLADAIYHIEGGAKTKYPYGIKSLNTGGDVQLARKYCMNTVRNNYKRWIAAGKPGKYLDFLADRYCPKKDDPTGNVNWKKNIRSRSGMDF